MNLTLEQDEKLGFMLSTIGESRKDLTEWEKKFFDDMVQRYDEYGAKVFCSSKQWAQLDRIYSKVTEVLDER